MKNETNEQFGDHYRVRQSWVNDFLICPERSRLAITMPKFKSGSDATAIGTGIHYAIEWALTNHQSLEDVELDLMQEIAWHSVQLELEKPIRETLLISEQKELLPDYVNAMIEGWYTEIAPYVQWGGKCEYQFEADTGLVSADGKPIVFTGTIDYVSPNGDMWDWKTAGKRYSVPDKQQRAIQPTVYCYAMQKLGLVVPHDGEHWFRYGVMVRKQTPTTQIATVVRNQEHFNWLLRQVESSLLMATTLGTDRTWPMNDQGALCSANWCDFWSVCKGASISR